MTSDSPNDDYLSHTVPKASLIFQEQLEAQFLAKAEIFLNKPIEEPKIIYLPKSRRLWRYRTAIALLIAVLFTATIFPTLAKTQFFNREDNDTQNRQAKVVAGQIYSFFEQLPPGPIAARMNLTVAQDLLEYPIYQPKLDIPLYDSTLSYETRTVRQNYFIAPHRSFNGAISFTFTQTPAEYYEPIKVGASAVIDPVQIGEWEGSYVIGSYIIQSTVVRGNDQEPIQPDSIRLMPEDALVLVDYETVWMADPQWQQVVWQQDDMVYSIQAQWQYGRLNITALAEAIANDKPIDMATLIGLPVGLPTEVKSALENITFYDDQEAVIFEYRDQDWWLFITEAPQDHPIFERPEIVEITRVPLLVNGEQGEYAEGVWEPMLLGSIRPFGRTSTPVNHQVRFQWIRWTVDERTHEIAVFNACKPQSQTPPPCYNTDELLQIAENLILTPPDYAARHQYQALVRTNQRPLEDFQLRILHERLEYGLGFAIEIPRHAKYLPWFFYYNGTAYNAELGAVWQLYTSAYGDVSLNNIPSYIDTPAVLIFQKADTRGSISQCQIPDNARVETVQIGEFSGQLSSGEWQTGTKPFTGYYRFCQAGQTFQSLYWNEGDMSFEILAIDVDTDLIQLAQALEPYSVN